MLRTGERIEGLGASMPNLIEMLADTVDRTVVDKTGFAKTFDFHLEFAPGEAISDSPSIFTALQEQLGLRLASAKGLVETLIIDHVERPSEN